MDSVNIVEAARRLGVSDKTVRRWIHAGKLRAHFPEKNHCEIAVGDLEPFMPGHLSRHEAGPMELRIAELERRVQELEHRIRDLLQRQEAPKQRRVQKVRERTTGPLPRLLVPLIAFAQQHNVSEQKVRAAIEMGLLPVKEGAWTDKDEASITLALDAKGRSAFYQLYQEVPPFLPCERCPHQETWTSVQTDVQV